MAVGLPDFYTTRQLPRPFYSGSQISYIAVGAVDLNPLEEKIITIDIVPLNTSLSIHEYTAFLSDYDNAAFQVGIAINNVIYYRKMGYGFLDVILPEGIFVREGQAIQFYFHNPNDEPISLFISWHGVLLYLR